MRNDDGTQHAHPGASTAIMGTTTWVGTWLSPILVAAFTILWCLLIYVLIGNRARQWQYGVMPYVPGQSFLSSQYPPPGPVPNQVVLPTQGGKP